MSNNSTEMETAAALERNGDFVAALRLYRDHHIQNPQDEDAVLGIAQCALALDNIELAFEFFVRLLILNHDNPWGYIGRANVLFRCEQKERALSDLARAIELDNPATQCRIDCAALLNEYGYCDLAYETILPIRNNYILDPDFISEWCFSILATKRWEHKDLQVILPYLESHRDDDPIYSLCLAAYPPEILTSAERGAGVDIQSLIREYPELEFRAQILGLCSETGFAP